MQHAPFSHQGVPSSRCGSLVAVAGAGGHEERSIRPPRRNSGAPRRTPYQACGSAGTSEVTGSPLPNDGQPGPASTGRRWRRSSPRPCACWRRAPAGWHRACRGSARWAGRKCIGAPMSGSLPGARRESLGRVVVVELVGEGRDVPRGPAVDLQCRACEVRVGHHGAEGDVGRGDALSGYSAAIAAARPPTHQTAGDVGLIAVAGDRFFGDWYRTFRR